MGVVVDLLNSLVRRRVGPPVRGRIAIAAAAFDQVMLQSHLDQLDCTKAIDVDSLTRRSRDCLTYGSDRRHIANVVMQAFPDAAWVLSFDSDGYIREAALSRIVAPAISAGRFVSLALRLNDWVPEVRAKAVCAMKKSGANTRPEIIAEASPFLLRQRYAWGRWGKEAYYLDEILTRDDVIDAIASMLQENLVGPMGSTLSRALRFPAYDIKLATLAIEARRPDVRAIALKTILSGQAIWPVGYGWEWIDKRFGLRRRSLLTESRPTSVSEPENLLLVGLHDRSALVRKVAADIVIERMASLSDLVSIAELLVADKSAAVRDRANYIMRHLPTPPSA